MRSLRHMLPSTRSAHACHHLNGMPAVDVLAATPVIAAGLKAWTTGQRSHYSEDQSVL